MSLYLHIFVVCCVWESLWDVKYLDTKTCMPTAFYNTVLAKQDAGGCLVAVSVWLLWLFVWLGWLGCSVWLGGVGLGWVG